MGHSYTLSHQFINMGLHYESSYAIVSISLKLGMHCNPSVFSYICNFCHIWIHCEPHVSRSASFLIFTQHDFIERRWDVFALLRAPYKQFLLAQGSHNAKISRVHKDKICYVSTRTYVICNRSNRLMRFMRSQCIHFRLHKENLDTFFH